MIMTPLSSLAYHFFLGYNRKECLPVTLTAMHSEAALAAGSPSFAAVSSFGALLAQRRLNGIILS